MSADTCCCGKVEIYSDCVSAIFNDYEHERYGEGRFCGPRWKHEVRDGRLAAMKAESDLARLRRIEKEVKALIERWEHYTDAHGRNSRHGCAVELRAALEGKP